jgi:hypothetical protein
LIQLRLYDLTGSLFDAVAGAFQGRLGPDLHIQKIDFAKGVWCCLRGGARPRSAIVTAWILLPATGRPEETRSARSGDFIRTSPILQPFLLARSVTRHRGVRRGSYKACIKCPPEEAVAEHVQAERLGTTAHLVVVLGLVVDKGGQVLYGEIVDPQVEGRYRFVGLDGIPTAVSDWLREVLAAPRRDES